MKEKILNNYYEEVLNIKELKHFLRITGEHEDSMLHSLCKSVIKYAEGFFGFEVSRKEIFLEGIYKGRIAMKEPLIAVNSVKSKGEDVDFAVERNMLKILIPVNTEVSVTYEAGLMEDEIPDDLKLALKQHIASLYDVRISGGAIPSFSLDIYNRYRMKKI